MKNELWVAKIKAILFFSVFFYHFFNLIIFLISSPNPLPNLSALRVRLELLVAAKVGDVQTGGVNAKDVGEELPGKTAGFFLQNLE
jgi:hypothetical protein